MRKNNKIISFLLYLLLGLSLIIAVISGYKVISYHSEYAKDRAHYEELKNNLLETVPLESIKNTENTEEKNIRTARTQRKLLSGLTNWMDGMLSVINRNRAQAPLGVNWAELKAINPDIIAWLYFTGLPQISYPVLQAEDNAYYVNRTYDLSSDTSKAGSIFMDYRMEGDFSSPYSIIYGHTVQDGSMLSDLPMLKDPELYEKDPYFWILTPDGDYLYRVFSIFQCHRSADVFQRNFADWGEDFSAWQTELQLRNVMGGEVRLKESGHVIAFSTCVPNSFDRTIVCGVYVDGDRIPSPHPAQGLSRE